MTTPPDDTRLTRINRMLRDIGGSPGGGDHDHPARRHKTDPHQPHATVIGGIGQEIKREETEQDAVGTYTP